MTNQSKRVQLIKDIYGVDVPRYEEYSLDYCLRQWAQMRSDKYFENAEKVIGAAEMYVSSGGFPLTPSEAIKTPTTQSPYGAVYEEPEELPAAHSEVMSNTADGNIEISTLLSTAHSALSAARSALRDSGSSANAAMATLEQDVTALAGAIGYGSLNWGVTYKNEIQVDFR